MPGILGQVNPDAGATETLFEATESTVISTIYVAETNAVATTMTICAVPKGQTSSTGNCLYNNSDLAAKYTLAATVGITLTEGEKITVSSASGDVTFTAFGEGG